MKMQLLLHETIYKLLNSGAEDSKFQRNPGIIIVQIVTKMIQCTFYARK